jgi:hypothetical protein
MPIWRNWGLNVEVQAHGLTRPASLPASVAIVQEALRLRRHVRALGRGWSFTELATTTDFMIDTRSLRGILALSQGRRVWGHRIEDRDRVDDPDSDNDPLPAAGYPSDRSLVLIDALRDDVLASDRRLVHILAGTTVREVYEALDAPARDRPVGSPGSRGRWALPTMGGASGQTFAGLIATGSHGGDFNLPPIADMVRAIHLIAPDGSQRWIEPAAAPISDPARLQGAMRELRREQLHYDDDMFNAALVALGSLGIVFSLVLEVRPQFGIDEVVHPATTWAAIRGPLADGSLFGDGSRAPSWLTAHATPARGTRVPRGLGLFINPYRSSGNYERGDGHDERSVLLITHAEADAEIGPSRRPAPGLGALDQAHLIADFESAGTLRDTATVVQRVLTMLRDPNGTDGYCRASSVLDTTSSGTQPILSLELAVTTANGRHVAVLDGMFAAFDSILREQWRAGTKTKFAGGIAVRFTRPTRALLGMQAPTNAADQRFCHIEVLVMKEIDALGNTHQGHSAMENNSELFVRAFEEVAARHNARLHWGQLSLTRAHRAGVYPGFERFMAVRDRLTRGGMVHTFDNAFAVRAGLVRSESPWVIRGGMVPAPPPVQAPTSTIDEGRTAPRVMLNPGTNCNELLVIAGDGQVARCRQQRPSSGWGEWELLPFNIRMTGRPAAVSDGTTSYVFARDADGDLFQTNNDARASAWANRAWGHFRGHRIAGSPAALLDRLHGWPYVVARCTDGRIRCITLARAHNRPGHFGDWEQLPALPEVPLGDPALAVGGDNLLHIFVRCADQSIWTIAQPRDKGWNWTGAWTRAGAGRVSGDPSVARHEDGHLEAFARGSDNRLWHAWQEGGGAWTAWRALGAAEYELAGATVPEPMVGGGGVALAVRDAASRVHIVRFGHERRWHDIALSGSNLSTVGDPTLGASADGRLELFSKASHDLVTHRWENRLGEW